MTAMTGVVRDLVLRKLLFASGLCLIAGCVPEKVTTVTLSEIDRYTVRTVAIVPFDILSTPQQSTGSVEENFIVPQDIKQDPINLDIGASSPELARFNLKAVPPAAAQKITHMFYNGLTQRIGVRVLPLEEVKEELEKLRAKLVKLEPRQVAQELATRLSADAALIGIIRVYRERVGSKIAASPAAVGFEVKLVSAKDGAVLWAGHYYEEQKPMNEDFMGFLKRKGQFLTAEELARYGTGRVLQKFPFGVAPESPSA